MKKTITILFLFCSIISFGQISAARKLLLAQEYKYPVFIEAGSDNYAPGWITVDLPVNREIGDLVVISIHGNSYYTVSVPIPTGWTLLHLENTDVKRWHGILYKFITGSESNSVFIEVNSYDGGFGKSFLYRNVNSINYISKTGMLSTTNLSRSLSIIENTLTCWYGAVYDDRQLTSSSSPGVLITSKTPYEEYLQLMTLSYSSKLGLGTKEGKITWVDNAFSNMILFELKKD